jgi:hypothetical protein
MSEDTSRPAAQPSDTTWRSRLGGWRGAAVVGVAAVALGSLSGVALAASGDDGPPGPGMPGRPDGAPPGFDPSQRP